MDWFRAVVLHRCPRCGARLVRRVALDESYTVTEIHSLSYLKEYIPEPALPTVCG